MNIVVSVDLSGEVCLRVDVANDVIAGVMNLYRNRQGCGKNDYS